MKFIAKHLKTPARFAVVGTLGFVTDATILSVLFHVFAFGHYSARILSFMVAVTMTWQLNRLWTFAERATGNRKREYTRYFIIQGLGAMLNFSAYSIAISINDTMAAFPVLALAVGSLTAMVFNFVGVRQLAFTGNVKRPA